MKRRISPLSDLPALWRLWRIVRRYRPDIVHAHTPKAGLLGMLAAWLALARVRVYTIHGLPLLTRTGWQFHVLRLAETLACRWHQRELREPFGAPGGPRPRDLSPAKVRTLGYGSCSGVNLQRFDPAACGPADRAAFARSTAFPKTRCWPVSSAGSCATRASGNWPPPGSGCGWSFRTCTCCAAASSSRRTRFRRKFASACKTTRAYTSRTALSPTCLRCMRRWTSACSHLPGGLPTVALECGAMQVRWLRRGSRDAPTLFGTA